MLKHYQLFSASSFFKKNTEVFDPVTYKKSIWNHSTLKDRKNVYFPAQRVKLTTLLEQRSLYSLLFPGVKQKSTCTHTQEKCPQRYPSLKETEYKQIKTTSPCGPNWKYFTGNPSCKVKLCCPGIEMETKC